jgi:hypothetical protein
MAPVSTTEAHVAPDQIVDSILRLAQQEQRLGNLSITQSKLDSLSQYVLAEKAKRAAKPLPTHCLEQTTPLPPARVPLPTPQFAPLFAKFRASRLSSTPRTAKPQEPHLSPRKKAPRKKLTFKIAERTLIEMLESVANVLDNLHLFSKLPMFPQQLGRLLQQTNKLWILILVFLIRKTISQLLNVRRKERKVAAELAIVRRNAPKILHADDAPILKRYEKVLKDLKFDKTMLVIELIGNLMDLAFNVIEFYGIGVPDWFMSALNAASMFMTIYRMNKDDEYIDDDITEDLL